MPRHSDFQKIYKRFTKQYGEKGESMYYAWLRKKGYKEEEPFPKKEKKEKYCCVKGCEFKEVDGVPHVTHTIATDHVDSLDEAPGIDIPDMIPKATLESWADQMNKRFDARIMGVYHSEGQAVPEYFGEADVNTSPAKVIPLNDGHWALWADTKLTPMGSNIPGLVGGFQNGDFDAFSVAYDTKGFMTTDFDWVDGKLVRLILPESQLYGYTASSKDRVVNRNTGVIDFSFKEFKEMIVPSKDDKKLQGEADADPGQETEETQMSEEEEEEKKAAEEAKLKTEADEKQKAEEAVKAAEEAKDGTPAGGENQPPTTEEKEFAEFKRQKAEREIKEKMEFQSNLVADKVAEKLLEKKEIADKALRDGKDGGAAGAEEISLEKKEFYQCISEPKTLEIKEQFSRAARICETMNVSEFTSRVEDREFKNFTTSGRMLEFKGLGITTNQNSDTDYLQSAPELQDVYDPIIYNMINQETITWNLLAKDDYSSKGNNKVQFKAKTTANTTATYYLGNSVTTGNVGRQTYETKFKKCQVGVSVDGDMIAAARGGPVGDVFAQELMDSVDDLMAVVNLALFAEVGLETAAGPIGFEYITDSASNTTLYNLTRSTSNYLAPTSASDTYINQSSTIISMGNLRKAKRQAVVQKAKMKNLVWITAPVQADLLRGKFDDARVHMNYRDTNFGFGTDLWVDGTIPVFEDKDCNTDDWWLVDLETHRIAVWVPFTVERLGKSADSDDAFVKGYHCTYNRAPLRMVQIYGAATS